MSACITPIFLHVTGRINQGGDTVSPGQPLLCIHIPCTVQQPPALCHQCHLGSSCPSQAPAQVPAGARRWQTCRAAFHQLLPYSPQALRRVLLEKHLVQQPGPGDSLAAGEPQGHSGHVLNSSFALPSITSPGNAVIALASALPLKLERVSWGDGVKLDWLCLLVVVSLTPMHLFLTQIQSLRYEK